MIYIIKYKNSLKSQIISYKVTKFFIKGYKEKKYFWEFIQIMRKFIIILLATFLRNQQVGIIYLIIPVIAAFLLIQIYNKPYQMHIFNNLETLSLTICFISYYCVLYLTMAQSESIQICLFVLFFVCNCVFLFIWAKEYFKVVKKQAKEIVSKVSSKLNSIGNYIQKSTSLVRKKIQNFQNPKSSKLQNYKKL